MTSNASASPIYCAQASSPSESRAQPALLRTSLAPARGPAFVDVDPALLTLSPCAAYRCRRLSVRHLTNVAEQVNPRGRQQQVPDLQRHADGRQQRQRTLPAVHGYQPEPLRRRSRHARSRLLAGDLRRVEVLRRGRSGESLGGDSANKTLYSRSGSSWSTSCIGNGCEVNGNSDVINCSAYSCGHAGATCSAGAYAPARRRGGLLLADARHRRARPHVRGAEQWPVRVREGVARTRARR